MTIHHPPFVVNESYARSSGLRDPSALWTLMAPGVWVMEKRLSNDEFLMVCAVAILTHDDKTKISGAKVQDFYKPVYATRKLPGDIDDYGSGSEANPTPHSWWLRVELAPESERIRWPQLPTKVNYKEGLDMGDLRELYTWNGLQFALRDEAWARP